MRRRTTNCNADRVPYIESSQVPNRCARAIKLLKPILHFFWSGLILRSRLRWGSFMYLCIIILPTWPNNRSPYTLIEFSTGRRHAFHMSLPDSRNSAEMFPAPYVDQTSPLSVPTLHRPLFDKNVSSYPFALLPKTIFPM